MYRFFNSQEKSIVIDMNIKQFKYLKGERVISILMLKAFKLVLNLLNDQSAGMPFPKFNRRRFDTLSKLIQ